MTDRHAGYIITLETDIREDDAEHLLVLLRHLKGVASVRPVVAEFGDYMARDRVRFQIEQALHESISDICK